MMNKFLRIFTYIMVACVTIENFAGKNDIKQDATSDEFYVDAGGAGADTGSKVGLFTLMFLANKAFVGWTSVKATAITLATSSAAPFVAGGAVAAAAVGGAGYAGYRTYRFFYPTSKEKLEAAKMRAEEMLANLQADQKQEERDLIKARQDFRNCLASNIKAPGNNRIPIPCREKATLFAIRAPEGEVEEIVSAFNAYKECDNY